MNNIPVGSVSGKDGWEWNQWYAEKQSQSESNKPPDRQSSRPLATERRRHYPKQDVAAQRKTQELEAELTRQKLRLQYVTDNYERLLAEKNRQLADQTREMSDGDGLSTILSDLRRWITER